MSYSREPVKSKVENLNPRSRRVNVTIKVVSKNPEREVVSRRDLQDGAGKGKGFG